MWIRPTFAQDELFDRVAVITARLESAVRKPMGRLRAGRRNLTAYVAGAVHCQREIDHGSTHQLDPLWRADHAVRRAQGKRIGKEGPRWAVKK